MSLFAKFSPLSLLLLTVLLFSGCGDDEDGFRPNDELTGRWAAESLVAASTVSSTITVQDQTFTSSTELDLTGLAFDYVLDLGDDGNFTAGGSYTIRFDATSTTNGQSTDISQTDNYTSVDNQGTYSATDDQLTINGSFFTLEYNGQPVAGGTDERQTVDYTLVGDLLTITQQVTDNSDQNGAMTTSTTTSTSTWRRQ